MRPALAVSALWAMTATALACGSDQVRVFSCTFNQGAKQVDICADAQMAQYRFGPVQGPAELALATPIVALAYVPWNGIGRSIYEQAAFPNADHTYTVFSAFDRMTLEPEQQLDGGIAVSKGSQEIAVLRCDAGSVMAELDALYPLKEAAGQCWSYDSFSWQAEC